jgi:hypothetical protein
MPGASTGAGEDCLLAADGSSIVLLTAAAVLPALDDALPLRYTSPAYLNASAPYQAPGLARGTPPPRV